MCVLIVSFLSENNDDNDASFRSSQKKKIGGKKKKDLSKNLSKEKSPQQKKIKRSQNVSKTAPKAKNHGSAHVLDKVIPPLAVAAPSQTFTPSPPPPPLLQPLQPLLLAEPVKKKRKVTSEPLVPSYVSELVEIVIKEEVQKQLGSKLKNVICP